jgi:hypothetical protein
LQSLKLITVALKVIPLGTMSYSFSPPCGAGGRGGYSFLLLGGERLSVPPCAQCSSPGCQNLARVILRKVAPGGAPDGQSEFCHQHARAGIAKATADGVGIYDMRTTTVKKL